MQIYSVDTSDFYFERELRIHKLLSRAYFIRSKLKDKISSIEKNNSKERIENINEIKEDTSSNTEKERFIKRTKKINKTIKKLKNCLAQEFSDNKGICRILNDDIKARKKSIISIFDSTFTRTLGMKIDELNDDIIVVQTFFFEILEEIIINGFYFNNEKYICFTASAGQIRTKKTVFIKEKVFEQHKMSLMCGLTLEKINELGGVNVNKYLAYLALCNSATDEWSFDLDKTIVVDDMELPITTEVDFIDDETFEIHRRAQEIEINHTDGCGMMLPKVSKKNFMIRMPWVKGLLVSFPFDEFIKDKFANKPCIVKDIYGQEYDIIKDDIQIIFTKSQFKMWKYYESWNQYKELFKKYDSRIGICNEEEDELNEKQISYQMLQTLTDITDKEIDKITKRTNSKIINLSRDYNTMLKVLGVSKKKKNLNHFQQALLLYPELLKDEHSKKIIKQIKKKLVKEGKSGKLDIESTYAFICPDLYAFCEYLFLGDKNPKGLLQNGEVSFSEKPNGVELDCLRSPHLYLEHAIRTNKINSETNRWFATKGIYTSIHDPISKILQFDCDGDKSLVVSDKMIIEIAKRNIKKYDVVPLFYNMKSSNPQIIDSKIIYDGMIAAYTGGNIGIISNYVTKIWNSEEVDIDSIKRLCAMNNYTIDYAKTLYKPIIPEGFQKEINNYIKNKAPYFFIYAKDYEKHKVEPSNNSTMNRIERKIVNKRLFFANNLNEFDYKVLMSNKNLNTYNIELIQRYTELDRENAFVGLNSISNIQDKKYTGDNISEYIEIRNKIYDEFLSYGLTHYDIVDHLVYYLFNIKKSEHKTTLWSSFGDIIVNNIRNNLLEKSLLNTVSCEGCGIRVEKKSNRTKYCEECLDTRKKELKKERNKRYYNKIKTF